MKHPGKAIILIVDDKPANIISLEGLLASKDRVLLSATSGKDALQITLNNNIDLIILDVQMPEMDGFEVAQILKSNKRTKDIPIIFATAENKEHRSIMQGYDEGAIDYLFKPLNPDIVRAKVAVLLKIQLQRKELLEKNSQLQKSALLINNSADIIGIIDGATFHIEEINDAFFTVLGYTAEEVKETSLSFFLPKEDRNILQSLNKEGKDQFSFESRVYSKDRRLKWLQWKVVAKKGKWYVNARDVTEIKEVEKIRNYLATVVKQSNDAIYIHDHEGKIISWNQGAEKIYGYSEQEALKMKIWNIIPEYMQSETGEMVNQVIYGRSIQDMLTQRMTKHGKLIDVLFSATVLSESDNGQLSIAITEKDITRQKLAEDKLRTNEQFLKLILNTMGEAVMVTDANGEPTLLNPAAQKMLGTELRKLNIATWCSQCGFFDEDGETIYPIEQLPFSQALKGKESVRAEMFIRNAHVPNGVSVIASSNPLKDTEGKIIGGVSVMLDISERKKAEKALRESELRFRNLFEFAPFPMWVYDLETLQFLEVNQPAIMHYGYSRQEFLQMKISDIRPQEDVHKLLSDIRERHHVVDSKAGWRHLLKNGQIIDVEVTSHLIDFRGHSASLVIAKDITAEKKADEKIKELNESLMINVRQLESANKELESFSYSVSHDLRAPLRGLNGYSRMLEEDYATVLDDEGKRLLANIQRNAHKMGMLIDDLLAFSRLGRKEVKKSTIDTAQMVSEVVEDIQNSSNHAAQIKIHQLPAAEADAALLRIVWTNLISNAIKYSSKKPNPFVEIGALNSDGQVVYYVKDNGTGFNMKYAEKLFGVFQRLHSVADFEGTGIGLATVQRIVAKHGGTVWADAKENEGATFYFNLSNNIEHNL